MDTKYLNVLQTMTINLVQNSMIVDIDSHKIFCECNMFHLLPPFHEICLRFIKIRIYVDTILYVDTSKFIEISDKFNEMKEVLYDGLSKSMQNDMVFLFGIIILSI
jgi:hypothetical protein